MMTHNGQQYVIRIDRDGRWFYNGNEIIHPRILRIFNDGLFLGQDNNHYLKVEDDIAFIEVEDAPFVVKRIRPVQDGDTLVGFLVGLSDESEEILDLSSLEINERNIPYCRVRGGMRARFTSQAYYMLAEHIEYNEGLDSYHIRTGGTVHPIVYRGEST